MRELTRLVKQAPGVECLFVQGACGDINPYLDKTPRSDGGVENMRAVGRTCAEGVLAAIEHIRTAAVEAPVLAYREQPVQVGAGFDLSQADQCEVLRQAFGARFDSVKPLLTPDFSVPLATFLIGPDLGFAFVPGEPFVQFQLDIEARSVVPNSLLCGYANGYHPYLATLEGAAAGGYGGIAATYVGAGAGEKLVACALTDLGVLSGRIEKRVTSEDFISEEWQT